jgi:hypothetical protein
MGVVLLPIIFILTTSATLFNDLTFDSCADSAAGRTLPLAECLRCNGGLSTLSPLPFVNSLYTLPYAALVAFYIDLYFIYILTINAVAAFALVHGVQMTYTPLRRFIGLAFFLLVLLAYAVLILLRNDRVQAVARFPLCPSIRPDFVGLPTLSRTPLDVLRSLLALLFSYSAVFAFIFAKLSSPRDLFDVDRLLASPPALRALAAADIVKVDLGVFIKWMNANAKRVLGDEWQRLPRHQRALIWTLPHDLSTGGAKALFDALRSDVMAGRI